MTRLLPLLLAAALAAPLPAFAQNPAPGAEGARSAKDPSARRAAPKASAAGDVDFGDDSGDWAGDGECDDKRFIGAGMASPPLLATNTRADASDCRAAFEAGTIRLRPVVTSPVFYEGIGFGVDSGDWANDDECDDKRFIGEGMTSTPLLDEDVRADASDCLAAFKAGTIRLRTAADPEPAPPESFGSGEAAKPEEDQDPIVHDGVDFGVDSSLFANDGECDDPRFEGEGMTSASLLDVNVRADASDCLEAYKAGTIALKEAAEEL